MRGHAAARRQNALGRIHAVNIFRAGFQTHQNHFPLLRRRSLRILRGKDDRAAGRSRRGGQSLGDNFLGRLGIQRRMQQLSQLAGGYPQDRFLLGDQAFLHHIHRHLDGGPGGPFAVTGLQHEQFLLFDGELDVLHVAVVLFQQILDRHQLIVAFRHDLLQRGQIACAAFLVDRLRSTDTGHHILALGIDQEFAVEVLLAGGGIAGKGNAGGAVIAHVAEDHRLHVDRGAPVRRNVVEFAVHDGPVVHPGTKDRANRAPQKFHRIARELLPQCFLVFFLEQNNQLFQIFRIQFRIGLHALGLLAFFKNVFQQIAIHAHNHVGVHLDKAPVGIVGETRIARLLYQAFHGLVVQSQIEHGVHHARHGSACARPYRNQQGVFLITELLAGHLFQMGQIFLQLRLQRGRIVAVVLVKFGADLRRNGKPWRNRQTDSGHFRQIGPLAAEQLPHVAIAFRLALTKEIDKFRHGCSSSNAFLLKMRSARFTGPIWINLRSTFRRYFGKIGDAFK